MAEEKMTLVERLRNPDYGKEDRLIADMAEGADLIDALRASLIRISNLEPEDRAMIPLYRAFQLLREAAEIAKSALTQGQR